jgi:hypothetical protein
MRMLKLATIVMGVMIVAGLGILVTVITQRTLAPPATSVPAVLDEPAGTRIAGISALPDRLALQLQGGGPDRVVMVDLRTGRVIGRASLAH